MAKRGNPYHVPAGSAAGGEFTHGPNSASGRAVYKKNKMHRDKLNKDTAAEVLRNTGSAGQDYYTLRSSQTSDIADAAKRYGYRKPKSASGSTARYFHQHLKRVASGHLKKK